ncbi:DUF6923 family protein [Luteolibacter algae]|uniref:DUF6923 family protein n=1 Tax=Luteolibacter algae TaxID=454151 RepID=A0ABW5D3G6_9BACT
MAADADADTIVDTVEFDNFSSVSSDLVVASGAFGSGAYAGWKGSVAETTAHGLAALEFNDTESGYGYFRITEWTGDQSASIGSHLKFGILVKNLNGKWATTTTRDVAFVSNSGVEINMDLKHGFFESQPPAAAFGEVCQYSVPLTASAFEATQEKFEAVMKDLRHIEIRSEFWSGVSGPESFLINAGSYVDVNPDTDGDGIKDYLDKDSDADGISDLIEQDADSDNDGLADYRDRDSDNDGIPDAIEGTADVDGDGIANFRDTDSDGDGRTDAEEGIADPDNDRIANYLDTDADNDGLKDSVEGSADNDGDGLANYLDADSDEDGIPDGADGDVDGDGIPNAEESFAAKGGIELVANGDFTLGNTGFSTSYKKTLGQIDQGVPQPNGAYEITEDANGATVNFLSFGDASGGGNMMAVLTGPTVGEVVWSQQVPVEPGMTYAFSAAVATAIPNLGPALDLRVNGVSLGVPVIGGDPGEWERTYAAYYNEGATSVKLEIVSAKTTLQASAFGLDDISFVPFTTDSDGDGAANFIDLDSDGDGLLDAFEGKLDVDGDGLPNFLDLDSDGDTIPDSIDGSSDIDADGQPGYIDTDSDNDSVEDFREGSGDFDGDGIPDFEDTDSDNDGTPDAPGEDSDKDGLWNSEETLTLDTDNDGTKDYLDLDSDGDGALDAVEGFNDTDADGIPDYRDYQPAFAGSGFAFESYNSPTQFALVDVNKGVFIKIGNTDHGLTYNAIAYNTADDYIYGLDTTTNSPELLRIGSDGSIIRMGKIAGLPRSYVAGTFADDGLYWVSGGGRLFGINVKTMSVEKNFAHSPNPNSTEIDLTFNPVNGKMYGSTSNGGFFEVDRTNGNTIVLGNNGKTFGALICDFNGAVYGFDNRGTGAYRVNLVNGSVTWVASAPKTNINDGTINSNEILVVDTDGDGISDEYDIDDDNDGTQDDFEGGTYNPNGDEDGDGIRNWTDTIDNGDNGDGTLTDYTDSSGDGIPDAFDVDGDGTPNHLDTDSDGDGRLDVDEAPGDADGDGLPNTLDADSDNDGLSDGEEGDGDTDGDGIIDYLDGFDGRDEDGDGILNGDEGRGDFDGDGIPNALDTDSDNDGVSDRDENARTGLVLDSDGDGSPNFLDEDDDNDGIPTDLDPCPLCNLEDNYIEFQLTDAQLLSYGVDPTYYSYARDVWNEVKTKLNCNTQGIPLEDEKRGFDEERFYLEEDSEVFVTVIYDGAKHVNSVAWYDAADPAGSWDVFWKKFGTGPAAPLVPGSTASLGILPAGTELRLGLVMDGGNAGEQKIYQDSYMNIGGLEMVASRIEVSGDKLVLAFEDQLAAGRDNDFNDVIVMIEIVPTAPATLQFGRDGLNSNAVSSVLDSLGLNDPANEITADLFQLPASGPVSIELLRDESPLDFTLSLVDYGKIQTVVPGLLEFREIAAANAVTVLDNRNADVGDRVTFDPSALGLAGKQVVLMLLPHNKLDRFVTNPFRYTPRGAGDNTKRQPLFSMINANPGSLDQFMSFTDVDSTIIAIEDHSRVSSREAGEASDSNFSDTWLRITPALAPMSFGGGGYYQGTPDPTLDWDGIDGYLKGQKGDF